MGLSRSAGAGSLQRTSSGRIGLIDELALKESTIRSRTSLSLILACALVGAAVVVPARADTESELDSAEQQLESARAELDRANQLWQEAEAELGRSRDAAEAARARIEVLQTELGRIRRELNERAASLFIAGGNPQAIALLTSESVSDAALVWLASVVKNDLDLFERGRLVASSKRELYASGLLAPQASGSVVGSSPSSGVLVRPRETKPARRRRDARWLSWASTKPASFRKRMPPV